MPDADTPVRQCTLPDEVDVHNALDDAGIEHLDVDDQRTIVIYLSAVLELIVGEGQLSATTEFAVELWEPPVEETDSDGDELLATFIDELLAVTETTRL